MQTWSRLAHRVLQLNAATLRMHVSGLEDGSTSLGLNMCGAKSIEVCLQIPHPGALTKETQWRGKPWNHLIPNPDFRRSHGELGGSKLRPVLCQRSSPLVHPDCEGLHVSADHLLTTAANSPKAHQILHPSGFPGSSWFHELTELLLSPDHLTAAVLKSFSKPEQQDFWSYKSLTSILNLTEDPRSVSCGFLWKQSSDSVQSSELTARGRQLNSHTQPCRAQ